MVMVFRAKVNSNDKKLMNMTPTFRTDDYRLLVADIYHSYKTSRCCNYRRLIVMLIQKMIKVSSTASGELIVMPYNHRKQNVETQCRPESNHRPVIR